MLPGDMSKRKPPQQRRKVRRLTSAWPHAGGKVPVSVADLFAWGLATQILSPGMCGVRDHMAGDGGR